MSADKLREAAKVLRERAKAATPGPWYWEPPSPDDWPSADESLMSSGAASKHGGDEVVLSGWGYDASGISGSDADRAYIATMHPGVGLLVAGWLDDAAAWEAVPRTVNHDQKAHDIADLILGGAS